MPSHAADAFDQRRPTVILDRPLAIIGFPGSGYRSVGRDLAAMTGLPLIDLDRWLEQQSGQPLRHLLEQSGLVAMRGLEAELLERALTSRPFGVVVLGDGALIDPETRDRVRSSAALVACVVPLATAFWELRRQQREGAAGMSPFLPEPLDQCGQLRPLWEERLPGLACAHLSLDSAGRQAADLVPVLIQALPQLTGAIVDGLEDG